MRVQKENIKGKKVRILTHYKHQLPIAYYLIPPPLLKFSPAFLSISSASVPSPPLYLPPRHKTSGIPTSPVSHFSPPGLSVLLIDCAGSGFHFLKSWRRTYSNSAWLAGTQMPRLDPSDRIALPQLFRKFSLTRFPAPDIV